MKNFFFDSMPAPFWLFSRSTKKRERNQTIFCGKPKSVRHIYFERETKGCGVRRSFLLLSLKHPQIITFFLGSKKVYFFWKRWEPFFKDRDWHFPKFFLIKIIAFLRPYMRGRRIFWDPALNFWKLIQVAGQPCHVYMDQKCSHTRIAHTHEKKMWRE